MRDEMYSHTVNDTDVICLVIHLLNETEIILYGLYNDINHIKMH